MNLELNDLLRKAGIDPSDVNVARHSPMEPVLRRTLPWLAWERRDLFEHFQSAHSEQTEKQLLRRSHLVSFIATVFGETVFAGAYERRDGSWIGWDDYWELPLTKEL
ncbi:MAG: GIY-YIG nuclease family protein, partial [Brucellaceae bacterium]|nr:GIY-YIG nuclease family protein [Brucellaceae bacterium]